MTFNNQLIEQVVHSERDKLVHELRRREKEILRLAASVCGNGPCSFFAPDALGRYHIHGSYNLVFFIELSDGQKCVFRIPLAPCLAGSRQDKLRSEIVTMHYLAEQTKIPVPKIFGYCVDDSTDPLATFLILEFINGEQLSLAKMTDLASEKRKNLFGSLADIYLQLRRLEFPSIGRLEGSASNPRIGKTATISMNMLQLEGLDSFGLRDRFLNEHGKLESATSYTNMLLAIGYDAFLKSPYTAPTGMGLTMSRNHQLFIQHVGKWVDTDRDKGPFVLVHGDLHISNLVIDDDARIISVLDWEWSSVVPVQYFTPPLWLNGRDSVQLASPTSWKLFLKRAFKDFLAIVESREIELYGNCQLHSEWSQAVENAEPLVANALLNWTDVDWLVERSMNCKQVPSDDEQAALVKENPTHGLLAEIKELDYDRYRQALQHLEAKKATEAEQAGVWNLMKRTCDVRQNASTVIILGCSVAACVIIAAVWRRL